MRLFALTASVVLAWAVQTWADDAPRFSMFEQSFHPSGTYDNPYQDLTAWAIFRRPDGKEWKMPLFWDGRATWILHVSPDLVGEVLLDPLPRHRPERPDRLLPLRGIEPTRQHPAHAPPSAAL